MILLRSELRSSEFASEFASEQPRNSLGMPRRHLDHVYKEHIDLDFDLDLDNEHDITYSARLSFTSL